MPDPRLDVTRILSVYTRILINVARNRRPLRRWSFRGDLNRQANEVRLRHHVVDLGKVELVGRQLVRDLAVAGFCPRPHRGFGQLERGIFRKSELKTPHLRPELATRRVTAIARIAQLPRHQRAIAG